jgi:hypothetical protein
MPDPDTAAARSSKLLPSRLAPQVPELPPLDPIDVGIEKLVPIDPLPMPTPAVVPAYSPIVCALAHGASNAVTAISAAGSNIFLKLMVFSPPGLLRVTLDTLIVASRMRQ